MAVRLWVERMLGIFTAEDTGFYRGRFYDFLLVFWDNRYLVGIGLIYQSVQLMPK